MPRIRTIKPEFPQSESMGRVSRDARLLFILLWTQADDSGRLRGASRMLASLLYPYDDDAPRLIDGWMAELDAENCIRRYAVEGNQYIQICKWLSHQKIDKPSESKIPSFDESSRILANALEPSLRIKDQDQGPGEDQDGDEPATAGTPPQPKAAKAAKATQETKPKPSECKFPVFPCSGNDGQWEAPPELLAELSAIYPAVDADAELRKAHFWIMSNIAKRKSSSGYPRYLGTWFKKAQDDASKNGRQAVARAVVAALPALTLPSEFTN